MQSFFFYLQPQGHQIWALDYSKNMSVSADIQYLAISNGVYFENSTWQLAYMDNYAFGLDEI